MILETLFTNNLELGTRNLRRILGVDLHVAVAQVAGKRACGCLTDVEHERYFVFTLANNGMECRRLGFVELDGAPAFEHLHVAEVQVGVFGHHVAAAGTRAAEDAAPVRVFTEHCALREVGRTDEARHAESFFMAFGLLDAQFDKLGSTFTITHDILRKALHNEHQRRTEFALFGEAQVFIAKPAHAVGQQDASVVRARVAIDGNRIEGIRDVGAEFGEEVDGERNVGRNEGKHGRHVRVDHARALAGAANRHHALLGVDFNGMALEGKVGREDGATEFLGSIGMQLFDEFRNARLDLVHRHQVANHARAADEHALRGKAQSLFGKGRHAFGILVALFAGTGVRVAAVHHDRGREVGVFKCSLVVQYRGGLHLVGGKNGEAARSLLAPEERHVGIAASLDASTNSRSGEPLGGTYAALIQQIVHTIS